MYKTILVTLDATPTDRAIIEHVKTLAKKMNSNVVLLHVATGVQAQWSGSDAGGEEVKEDKAYLAGVKAEYDAAGIPTRAQLAFGDPVTEIVKWVQEQGCDLVAMSTHGHK
jgi:nucleotide-binding universal stress UspA family protein